MDITEAIKNLEVEREQIEAKGFFGQLRYKGVFDEEGFNRVRAILNAVEIPTSDTFDRRFIELTWFIPTYLHWERDGWHAGGKATDRLDEAIAFFEQRLTTILGLP